MEKEANGKPIFFWASSPATHPNIQDDHDLETELYPVEYLAGQRLLAGTADYRNLFQHRIQR